VDRITESQFKKEILKVFSSNVETAREEIKKFGKPNSILETKQMLNKVLKTLREELAMTNSIAVKRMNADLIEYESGQRQQVETMRGMSHDQLIKIVGDLKSEILSLRINEIYMKKSAEQVKAIKSALKIMILDAFETSDAPKVLRCLEETLDAISKEIRNCWALDSKSGSMIRNEFNFQLQEMFDS